MKVQVYIGSDKLDLFGDESVTITQKLNDIEKLSNVFTDFTNSFTVPATSNNNRILKHYYDVDINNGFNASVRVDGFIEIDTLPFKYGKVQLESVDVKSNSIDNYKITFYGATVQLTELFANDILGGLTFSNLEFGYNETNLLKTINDETYLNNDILTPLISYTDRDWEYNVGGSYNIANSSYPVRDYELRSAIRVIRIIEAIENKYGVKFSRNFFGTEMFNKLYLWMNSTFTTGPEIIPALTNISRPYPSAYISGVSTTNNIFTFTDNAYNWVGGNRFNLTTYLYGLRKKNGDTVNGTNVKYYLYNDDELVYTEEKLWGSDAGDLVFFNYWIDQQDTTPKTYNFTFKIVIDEEDIKYSSTLIILGNNFGTGPYDTITLTGGLNLKATPSYSLPKMKIIDFLQGIMKMFKLIIRPITATTFSIMTLDSYYSTGNVLNLTNYVNIQDVVISRPDIYSKIRFSFEKTESVAGKKWRNLFGGTNEIGYGDEYAEYNISNKNELEVKLPFENMLFDRMSNAGLSYSFTNILIGQSIKLSDDNTTISKNDMKPLLFFYNKVEDISSNPIKFKFLDESVITLNSYKLVSNTDSATASNVTTAINWGLRIDPWHMVEIEKSLFNNYWSRWINTIYSIKQRKFKFEAYLPPRYIIELSLNDRIIIGQNIYKINDYTVDLVTGKATLNLFNDV